MYVRVVKRVLDILISFFALAAAAPVILVLAAMGAVKMKGNPFFTQERPGMNEKVFRLIKFRSMTCEKDAEGRPLPDDVRLTGYGRLLRSTSLDELPELMNILAGHMSLVGPRPLLVEYLPYYTDEERLRHSVRPGLTGWAQVNGRNNIYSWEERFAYDLEYVEKCSFIMDLKIMLMTVRKVVKRSDILVGSQISVGRLDDARRGKTEDAGQYKEVC